MIITALDETEKDRATVIRSKTFKNTPYIDDFEKEKEKKRNDAGSKDTKTKCSR